MLEGATIVSTHLFVPVPYSAFPSVTLNEQSVLSLKDIPSTCTPAQIHHYTIVFLLDIIFSS